MHRSTLPKLLALFISGSILFSSVPVYAGETASFTESVTEEAAAEPDDTVDNSDEGVNGFLADEEMAGESLTDTVDENRETPAGSDSGFTTGDGSNTLDSRTDGNEANVEEICVDSGSETTVGGADTLGKSDIYFDDTDTLGKSDTNTSDADTPSKSDRNIDDADTPGKSDGNTDDTDTLGKSNGNSGDFDTPMKTIQTLTIPRPTVNRILL